jgi:hypothetical protein
VPGVDRQDSHLDRIKRSRAAGATEDLQPWIDWNETQVTLFEGAVNTAREWAMLGSTTMIWIGLPLVVGLLALRHSEVK